MRKWPTASTDNRANIEREWGRLDDDDRQRALDGVGPFAEQLKKDGRTKTPAGATYLKNRGWEGLPPEADAPERISFKNLSRTWWAVVIRKIERGKRPGYMVTGSSPRVRGTANEEHLSLDTPRFIPARAGNGGQGKPRLSPSSVHPRACGERGTSAATLSVIAGSSPRVRGTGEPEKIAAAVFRFIPARAGNGSIPRTPGRKSTVHPRACGEQE